jgi:hypothetical protein
MAPRDFDAARNGSAPRAPDDEFDVPLEDPVQMEEVELLSSLMIQAGGAEGPLGQDEIDRLLGVERSDG